MGREASKPGRAALQELGGQRVLVVLSHRNPGQGFQHNNVHFTAALCRMKNDSEGSSDGCWQSHRVGRDCPQRRAKAAAPTARQGSKEGFAAASAPRTWLGP